MSHSRDWKVSHGMMAEMRRLNAMNLQPACNSEQPAPTSAEHRAVRIEAKHRAAAASMKAALVEYKAKKSAEAEKVKKEDAGRANEEQEAKKAKKSAEAEKVKKEEAGRAKEVQEAKAIERALMLVGGTDC